MAKDLGTKTPPQLTGKEKAVKITFRLDPVTNRVTAEWDRREVWLNPDGSLAELQPSRIIWRHGADLKKWSKFARVFSDLLELSDQVALEDDAVPKSEDDI